ncbi:hypothetical protein [Deinococcus sp. QL22]|uniref:hypothetical protein n=1 Tax=Deinococcus sp. QL22 TaxID=2939437 RepID=UPI002017D0CA|nr:hypothetical protein [Deinococcus sp. QL22]UQN07937.1 hypothetical protein M1R55_17705 [Deinococcus sp. QL22]
MTPTASEFQWMLLLSPTDLTTASPCAVDFWSLTRELLHRPGATHTLLIQQEHRWTRQTCALSAGQLHVPGPDHLDALLSLAALYLEHPAVDPRQPQQTSNWRSTHVAVLYRPPGQPAQLHVLTLFAPADAL